MPYRIRTANAALVLAVASAAALAQTATPAAPPAKAVTADTGGISAAFDGFARWLSSAIAPTPVEPIPPRVEIATFSVAPPPGAGARYEPLPVILGEPAVRLAGATPASLAKGWGPSLNYQGMQVRVMVLDASGKRHMTRPVSEPIRVGERFKLMVTPTFDAVASIDDIHGSGWTTQRGVQTYPAPGSSVSLTAGQPTLIPVGANYFVADKFGARRYVLSVRHPKATGDARSSQPAYRQDAASGSSYLQLVPASTYPAFEQLLVTASK